jgi:hypothetical protein
MHLPTARQLQRLARKHREIADHLDAAAEGIEVVSESTVPVPVPETSLDRIRKFLQGNGPTRRTKISDGTGIPMGTIAGLLTPENGFERNEGLWSIKAEATG